MTPLIRHRLVVRFNDCDPLGHINNATYFTYLEQARFTLWRAQLGFLVKSGPSAGPRETGFILARAEMDFKAQARHGDELEVQLSLATIGRTSFTYAYEIVELDRGAVVASARTIQVHFNYDTQEPVPIDEELRLKLSAPIV
jgi:acyl-CoA thioester hydrolase